MFIPHPPGDELCKLEYGHQYGGWAVHVGAD
jgi:hypothetical protein